MSRVVLDTGRYRADADAMGLSRLTECCELEGWRLSEGSEPGDPVFTMISSKAEIEVLDEQQLDVLIHRMLSAKKALHRRTGRDIDTWARQAPDPETLEFELEAQVRHG